MNRLTITNKDKSVALEDLEIKFPDDIKWGSYSITVPNTPELSEVLTSGSLDATLASNLSTYWSWLGEPVRGKVIITSKTADSINFNFIRTDYGAVGGIYYGDGSYYEYTVPTINTGLSAFPDTKVSTIGTYKAYDFTNGANQGELTWRNIYGLKTKPRENPIEVLPTDYTPVWSDPDPVTAYNPFGNACKTNYSFRYSGEYNPYRFGGQNRLMTFRIAKFTCLETGFYDASFGYNSIEVANHAANMIEGSWLLNVDNFMWTTPSVDLALIDDSKFDDLKEDFILYPKQESYISVKEDPAIGGEVNDLFNKHFSAGIEPTYPHPDGIHIGHPTGYSIGVDSELFTVGDITYGTTALETMNALTSFPTLTNKDGVVMAQRIASSEYFADNIIEDDMEFGLFPSDVRGMVCIGVKDSRLKMAPLYDGTLGITRSSLAPYVVGSSSRSNTMPVYFGNKVAYIGHDALTTLGDLTTSLKTTKFNVDTGEETTKILLKGGYMHSVFLEAGKTYSIVIQVSSCPVIVMHDGQKELRFMFPKKVVTNLDKNPVELSFKRTTAPEHSSSISPSPHDIGVGKLSELPVIDTLDASFWGKGLTGTIVNTISLNPKGDYYDFARGILGYDKNGVDIRQYNKLLLDRILTMDFKVTATTSLNEFSLGVRDVDGIYRDVTLDDFIAKYNGVGYEPLYSGNFDSIHSAVLDFTIPMTTNIVKSKMAFAVRNTTQDEDDNTVDNAFEDTYTLTFSRNADHPYRYDFLSLNHDTAKEINNYIEVTDFPCQFQVGDSGNYTWVTTCSSNIVDVLNIDTIKETCTVRFYLPTAGYLL